MDVHRYGRWLLAKRWIVGELGLDGYRAGGRDEGRSENGGVKEARGWRVGWGVLRESWRAVGAGGEDERARSRDGCREKKA